MTKTPDILCAGEALVDMIPDGDGYRAVPGGAVFNSACAAGRLGASVAFLGALSQDSLGQRLADAARDCGVNLDFALRPDAPCPLSVVTLSGGDATYAIHHRDTAHSIIERHLFPTLPKAKAMLLGGFSLIHAPAAETFEQIAMTRPAETLLYLDLNIRPDLVTDAQTYRARLDRLVARADVIKASDEDLDWWDQDLDRLAPNALILRTQGADGAVATVQGVTVHVSAPRAQVVDTVGAGDAFNAAWLAFGLKHNRLAPRSQADLSDALTFAVTAASLSTQRAGANGPTWEEVECAL